MKNTALFLVLFLLLGATVSAQVLVTDINGRPLFENTYTDIDGIPYLRDAWSLAIVKTPNGKTHEFAKTKFDGYKNELIYEKENKMFVLSQEIIEFHDVDGTFRRNLPSVDGQTQAHFYEVLHDGKVKLLKYNHVKLTSEKPYNSATEIKRFSHEAMLYVLINNQMKRVKKDKKSLLEALTDQQTALEQYIKDQKIKLSKPEEMARLIEYYETL